MDILIRTGATREIGMVLALALVGLTLAALVVFTPWYGASADGAVAPVVELRNAGQAAQPGARR